MKCPYCGREPSPGKAIGKRGDLKCSFCGKCSRAQENGYRSERQYVGHRFAVAGSTVLDGRRAVCRSDGKPKEKT